MCLSVKQAYGVWGREKEGPQGAMQHRFCHKRLYYVLHCTYVLLVYTAQLHQISYLNFFVSFGVISLIFTVTIVNSTISLLRLQSELQLKNKVHPIRQLIVPLPPRQRIHFGFDRHPIGRCDLQAPNTAFAVSADLNKPLLVPALEVFHIQASLFERLLRFFHPADIELTMQRSEALPTQVVHDGAICDVGDLDSAAAVDDWGEDDVDFDFVCGKHACVEDVRFSCWSWSHGGVSVNLIHGSTHSRRSVKDWLAYLLTIVGPLLVSVCVGLGKCRAVVLTVFAVLESAKTWRLERYLRVRYPRVYGKMRRKRREQNTLFNYRGSMAYRKMGFQLAALKFEVDSADCYI